MYLGKKVKKKLILLHGFLGGVEDWSGVISFMENKIDLYPLPLPQRLSDFPMILKEMGVERALLAGYSMGGRVALLLHALYPERVEGLALLSAHFGLLDEQSRKERWEEDLLWIDKLKNLPLKQFLALWYRQPLFQGFTPPPQRFFIDPLYHADLLYTYSLGKQPCIDPPEDALYLFGEKDLKYQALYHKLKHSACIMNSGHAVHLENPIGVANAMESFWNL